MLADLGVDQHRGGGLDGLDFLPEQPPRDVEVVDRHVAEDPAGTHDVVVWRGTRVTGGQGHHLDLADPARVDHSLQRLEVRVEAPLKADHQGGAGFLYDLEADLHPLDGQVDRLFAEDALAGAREPLDQIRVCVGGVQMTTASMSPAAAHSSIERISHPKV